MMTRESETVVLDFCARQSEHFDENAWLTQAPLGRSELAIVALFLAGVDWYGHRSDLLGVAERLHKDSSGRFSEMARGSQFDCSRFSNLLRRRLRLNDHG